jgi:hypothetical protein
MQPNPRIEQPHLPIGLQQDFPSVSMHAAPLVHEDTLQLPLPELEPPLDELDELDVLGMLHTPAMHMAPNDVQS